MVYFIYVWEADFLETFFDDSHKERETGNGQSQQPHEDICIYTHEAWHCMAIRWHHTSSLVGEGKWYISLKVLGDTKYV